VVKVGGGRVEGAGQILPRSPSWKDPEKERTRKIRNSSPYSTTGSPNMTQKCVHKGCGKVFTDPEEPCIYHPGPPEFHEGQKGRHRLFGRTQATREFSFHSRVPAAWNMVHDLAV
jgi:hypothetical protein